MTTYLEITWGHAYDVEYKSAKLKTNVRMVASTRT